MSWLLSWRPRTSKVSNDVNDAIKRIVDQNQASLDNSVINVELANYALQLSRLTSPPWWNCDASRCECRWSQYHAHN